MRCIYKRIEISSPWTQSTERHQNPNQKTKQKQKKRERERERKRKRHPQNPLFFFFFFFFFFFALCQPTRHTHPHNDRSKSYNEMLSISRMTTASSARFAASATKQKSCRKGAVAVGPPFPCIWWGYNVFGEGCVIICGCVSVLLLVDVDVWSCEDDKVAVWEELASAAAHCKRTSLLPLLSAIGFWVDCDSIIQVVKGGRITVIICRMQL